MNVCDCHHKSNKRKQVGAKIKLHEYVHVKGIKSKRSEQSIMPKKKSLKLVIHSHICFDTVFFFYFFLELRDLKKALLMLSNQSQIHANKQNKKKIVCVTKFYEKCVNFYFWEALANGKKYREKNIQNTKRKFVFRVFCLFKALDTLAKHSFFSTFHRYYIFLFVFFFNLFFPFSLSNLISL